MQIFKKLMFLIFIINPNILHSIPIFGPDGYKVLIDEYKKYLDDKSYDKAEDTLQKIKDFAVIDIKNNIPLRAYLASRGLYHHNQIYQSPDHAVTTFTNIIGVIEAQFEKLRNLTPEQKDSAYQKYLVQCKEKKQKEMPELTEHLEGITSITDIVHEYDCISYDDWIKNNNALIKSIKDNDLNTFHQLITSGKVDINAVDAQGDPTIIVAIKSVKPYIYPGHIIIHNLVTNGANINSKDKFGNTAFDYAVNKDDLKAITSLLSYSLVKADINILNKALKTASNKHPRDEPIIKLLKDKVDHL